MENMVVLKKVVITGWNGFIGTHLVKLLKEAGYYTIGIDTNYFGDDCKFSKIDAPHKTINKDVRLIEKKDLEGVYAVCHLAALSNDPMGALNESLTHEINHKASVNLARLAKKVGVKKFIFSSSCSMYGIAGEEALDESTKFAPVTAYAKSKVNTEKDVRKLADHNFSVTFLRNGTAYGISPKLRLDLVVNNLVGWAMTTGEIRIMSDGTPWRPLIHAEDIARAFVAVIETSGINRASFNVGQNNENYQIKDVARLVGEVVPNCKVVITGEHGSDSRSYRVDFTKINKVLPRFRPKWTLEDGIVELYREYKKYGMDEKTFNGRYFNRLKQIKYLQENNYINENLYWI